MHSIDDYNDDPLMHSIEGAGFSIGMEEKLWKAGFARLWELARLTESELLELPGFGKKTIENIKSVLAENELHLGMDVGIFDATAVAPHPQARLAHEKDFEVVLLTEKLAEWDLSIRATDLLKNDNILYAYQLAQKTETELLRTPNAGRKTVRELRDALEGRGLQFGMSFGFPADLEREKQLEFLTQGDASGIYVRWVFSKAALGRYLEVVQPNIESIFNDASSAIGEAVVSRVREILNNDTVLSDRRAKATSTAFVSSFLTRALLDRVSDKVLHAAALDRGVNEFIYSAIQESALKHLPSDIQGEAKTYFAYEWSAPKL